MKRKITLDILMTSIMVCLLNTNFTGLLLHELFGIGIFFLFAFHKLFNLKWIKAVTRNLFKKSVKAKTRLLYGVDVLLLVLATANVLTGILISTRILTGICADDIFATSQLHHILAYSLCVVLAIHVGLHWSFVRNAMKIQKNTLTEKLLFGVIAATLVLVLLCSNTVKKFLLPQPAPDFYYQAEMDVPFFKEEETEADDEDDAEAPEDTPSVPDIPTLQQFLSNLICNGCGRRCLLSNPACGKGRRQQEEAIQEYNQVYHVSETYVAEEAFPYDEDYFGEYRSEDYDAEEFDGDESYDSTRPRKHGKRRHES